MRIAVSDLRPSRRDESQDDLPAAPGSVEVLNLTPERPVYKKGTAHKKVSFLPGPIHLRTRGRLSAPTMEQVSPSKAALLSPGGGAAEEAPPPRPPLLRSNTAFHATQLLGAPAKGILESLPVGTNGIALGLCGLSGIAREWKQDFFDNTLTFYGFTGVAGALWLLFTARCVFAAPRAQLVEELGNPRVLFAYGAYQMTYLFVLARFLAHPNILPQSLVPGACVGAVAQLLLLIAFFVACYRKRCYPEPLWNPPTVNCAVTSIVLAPRLGANQWVVMGSFLLAVSLQATLVPPQVWRTVRDRTVSPSASVSMMQAPCSLNALTFAVMRRSNMPDFVFSRSVDAHLGHGLFFFSTLVFWLTLYGVWDRRAAIRHRGFDLSWAAFTFPSCSTAIVTLQYSMRSSDPAASGATGARLLGLKSYSILVTGSVVCVVLFVAAGITALALKDLGRRWRRSPSRRYLVDVAGTPWSPTRLPSPMHLDRNRLSPWDEAGEDSECAPKPRHPPPINHVT